jgi:tetratricopeptide (TPR) repeat protein
MAYANSSGEAVPRPALGDCVIKLNPNRSTFCSTWVASPRGSSARLIAPEFSIWCLLAILAWVPAQGSSQTSSVQSRVDILYRAGAESYSQGDYKTAAEKFREALKLEPFSPQLLSNLGVTYHMEGRYAEAVKTLTRALELNPRLPPASLILGLDLVRLNKPRSAIEPLETVLQEEPANRDALLDLASANFALQRYGDAVRVYLHEVAIRPNDADAWYGMGICFEHLAENTTRETSERDPESPYYHRLVGEFLLSQGEAIDAEQAFRKALLLSHGNDSLGLHAALGFALLRSGQFSEANGEFRTEVKEHSASLEATLGLAALDLEQGKTAPALPLLCSVYKADLGFFVAHLNLLGGMLDSKALTDAGRQLLALNSSSSCARAGKLFQREITAPATAIDDDSAFRSFQATPAEDSIPAPEALVAAGTMLRSGHYTQCAKTLETVSRLDPRTDLVLARCACLSGRFYLAFEAAQKVLSRDPADVAGRYWETEATKDLARAALSRAVLLSPNSWQGHLVSGDIYRQRKQWSAARSNYQAAAQLEPSSPAPYLGVATVDWRLGEFADAQSELQKVLVLDPRNLQAEFEMGDILVRKHRFQAALPYLEKTVTAEPGLLVAHGDLGKCYASLGEVNSAVSELVRALPTDQSGELHFLLYLQYKKEHRSTLAQEALNKSQKLRALAMRRQQTRLQEALRGSDRQPGKTPQAN